MWLTVNSGPEQGISVEMTGPRFVLGRGDSCDLVVDDEKVSREHAAVETDADGQTFIRDLGSSNGTFVNGKRITEPTPLAGGEHVRIGDTAIALSASEPSRTPETVVAPPPTATPTQSPAPSSEPSQPAIGRSTVQRIVDQAIRGEDARIRRSTKIATGVAVAALFAAAAVGALFATGTIGGGNSANAGPNIANLERGTVLISDLDSSGNVTAIGSGTIIRPDGYILTNSHVAEPDAAGLAVQYGIGFAEQKPAALEISLFQGEAKPAKAEYLGKTVAYDGYIDAAVVKIVSTVDGKPVSHLHLPTVPIGNSDKLLDGQPVTVVGYPAVGGGFQGEINVSRGTVSGFQRDTNLPGPRGWIKTDAAINHGNSGGLAANDQGQLIGIPSRIQCGNDLFSPCSNPTADRQGKIRPVALALPIISAAEHGQNWTTRSIVIGTGQERFTFQGWAAREPDSQCNYTHVTSYPSSARSVTAVFSATGMTANEDIALLQTYGKTSASSDSSNEQQLDRWYSGWGHAFSCYWINSPVAHGSGWYSLAVFAGAYLRQASSREVVKVG
jgi:putative serine protease PepD